MLLVGVKGGAGGRIRAGNGRGSTVTGESGLDRRGALKALLAVGAAAPLAWTQTACAATLTSRQLAGQRVIFKTATEWVALLRPTRPGPPR